MTLEDWQKLVLRNTSGGWVIGWEEMLVFADWCADHDEPELERSARFMARTRCRAWYRCPGEYYWGHDAEEPLHQSYLPPEVYEALDGWAVKLEMEGVYDVPGKAYPTREAADRALGRALLSLGVE